MLCDIITRKTGLILELMDTEKSYTNTVTGRFILKVNLKIHKNSKLRKELGAENILMY
jgi:hypothetical protein